MRLIDADYFKEQIAAATLKESIEPKKGLTLMEVVDAQPTAYDVDNVVKQLEKMQVYKFQGKLPDGRICHFSDAIEIVKAGGANE